MGVVRDEYPNYKPHQYTYKFYETKINYTYKTYKLLDQQEKELAASDNPFAMAILAGIYVIRSKRDNAKKFLFKLNLVRLLLSKKWEKEKIDMIFRFLDGIIRLNEDEALQLKKEVDEIMKKKGDEEMGLTWDKTNLAEVYWKKGNEQGLTEGQRKKALEMALNLLKEGVDAQVIVRASGLDKEEVERLAVQLNNK
ncbi:hypothetical protein BKP45_07310 [Anaerobacillus alkalidiazotrophicus]|uniref:Transposase n=1 Tax=Anaerobacillus alkalidiazotrophicus TaxID=472963 RepID=A0A1S2M843_9BACI|nr:hypothetical protein [Anaerobacillus alkalidiazotrophicus]OIJ20992.1 hypothetical protein BKP45_07310 [Anaerobacillus alkalidiazotrophicus]